MSAPTTFAEVEAHLAEALPGYESRPPQQYLAAAVSASLEQGTHLLAQAGTGTGKSLGYLIPAILSGRRVIVSTATKALQDQIAGKDLPFLEEHIGVPFTWALLKGRSNYFCMAKAASADPGDVPNLRRMIQLLDQDAWDGSRDGLPFEIAPAEWMKVCGDADDCRDNNCKENPTTCFAQQAKDAAKRAQIVVVNHALFLTDVALRERTGGEVSLLDEYEAVVFDEAHEVESYASNALGQEFKESGIRGLCTEALNFARRHVNNGELEGVVDQAVTAVLTATQRLWSVIEPGRVRLATIEENADEWIDMANALADLSQVLTDTRLIEHTPAATLDKARKQKRRLARRANNAFKAFHEIVTYDFDELVRWVEEERGRRGEVQKVLKSAPVTVADFLRTALFDNRGITAILTSATLAVAGKGFAYIAGRLGIDSYESLDVGTPFTYEKQARLYVPTHLPEPTPQNRAAWSNMMRMEVVNLIKASKGRALVLFTSNKEMRSAYEAIGSMIDYPVRMQGQATNRELAEWFKTEVDSVLFATRSFMTGVDFQGETLSLVVLDKLPFPMPTDPIVEARCDSIDKAGGRSFNDYVVPEMSLVLLQAFGRLIRHRSDFGVMAILDPRLKTKAYGKTISKVLPPAAPVSTVEEVETFFAEGGDA